MLLNFVGKLTNFFIFKTAILEAERQGIVYLETVWPLFNEIESLVFDYKNGELQFGYTMSTRKPFEISSDIRFSFKTLFCDLENLTTHGICLIHGDSKGGTS